MKHTKLTNLFLGCAVVGAMSAVAFAQESYKKTDKASAEQPAMVFVMHEFVKPAKIQEYEAYTKDLIAQLDKKKISAEKVGWKTVSGPEMGYTYVIPIKDFADFDRAHQDWQKAMDQLGKDAMKEGDRTAAKTVDRRSSAFAMLMTDLSHHPENPEVPQDEVQYVKYAFYYGIPGKEQELEGVAKDYARLYRSKNIRSSWSFYKVITGEDLPLYVVAMPARSAIDLETQKERNKEILGSEVMALESRAMAATRRIDLKEGWIRPDLSYPAMEMPDKDKKTKRKTATGREDRPQD